jgi:hypothetical protein
MADFTYHTDFAQVEADQEVVNLTRFSLFFPEKRQFFTETAGIFDFGKSVAGLAATPPPTIRGCSIFSTAAASGWSRDNRCRSSAAAG